MSGLVRTSMLRAVGLRAGSSAGLVASRSTVAGMMMARRFASTESLSAQDNLALLNSQREKRPTSPHLAIYQPQITWYLSGLNRITGVALSGILYIGSMVYLLHPLYSSIDSAHLIQIAHDLPGWVKGSIKALLAAPFAFHSLNGVRHLLWDVGKGLTLKGVYTGGYAVLAATAASTIYLAFFV